jgi:hypothetical protein
MVEHVRIFECIITNLFILMSNVLDTISTKRCGDRELLGAPKWYCNIGCKELRWNRRWNMPSGTCGRNQPPASPPPPHPPPPPQKKRKKKVTCSSRRGTRTTERSYKCNGTTKIYQKALFMVSKLFNIPNLEKSKVSESSFQSSIFSKSVCFMFRSF